MKINLGELREVNLKLLEHLAETIENDVEIDVDFYWDIPAKERYNPNVVPTNPELGQLSDDWFELKRMIDGKPSLNYGLVWLSTILRRLGETSRG
jgi:hypothetical protein